MADQIVRTDGDLCAVRLQPNQRRSFRNTGSRDRQRIMDSDLLHDHTDQVVPVLSSSDYVQAKIYLGICFSDYLSHCLPFVYYTR